MHSTSWKFSTSFYILFMSSKRLGIFSKCSHPYAKNLKHLRMYSSHLLFFLYYWEISWHGISWKLTLRMFFDKRGHKLMPWIESCDFPVLERLTMSANVCNFLVKMSTFKQVIKLTFEHNKFAQGQCKIPKLEYYFRKSHVIKLINWLTIFIYPKVSPI